MMFITQPTLMEEPETPNRPVPREKIFSRLAILVSTFLAGPMAGGYMLAENFRAFGERSRAKWSLIISILSTVLLMTVANLIPFIDKVPPVAFSAAAFVVIHQMIGLYQAERMGAHFHAGGAKAGIGKIIMVCIISLILTVALAFGGAYLLEPAQNLEVKNYGTLRHEIGYDPGNIAVEEVDRVAEALTTAAYFDSDVKKTVDVTREEGKCEVFIYCSESVRNNREAFEVYGGLRDDVQQLFPDKKIAFNLVLGTRDNVLKRLE